VLEDVGVFDRHTGHSSPELSYPMLIDVDGGERSAQVGEVTSQRTATGTDLEDRPRRDVDDRSDHLQRGGVNKEILAELFSAAVG